MAKKKHPVTRQILSGKAPGPIQEYAAKGLLPLPGNEFLDIWVYLTVHGAHQEIRDIADDSIANLDQTACKSLFERLDLEPMTLNYCAERFCEAPELAALLATNRSMPDEGLAYLAQNGSAGIIDVIVINQTRLIQSPVIVTALKANPVLTAVHKRRIMEFEQEFIEKRAEYKLTTKEPEPAVQPVETVPPPVEQAAQGEPTTEVAPAVEEIPEVIPEVEDLERETNNEPERILKKIATMTVPQKIMLALFGNREARMILIREPNRLISEAVIKSPKLSESEAESIAAMRHLDMEVIRLLAARREFHRNRTFVYRLATNPKTPAPIAINLVSHLNIIQLRTVARSRDIPENIRRFAKNRLKRLQGL